VPRRTRLELEALEVRTLLSGGINVFPIPTPNSAPAGITAGPDGAVWFSEDVANKIARITPGGSITEFNLPAPLPQNDASTRGPGSMVSGPDHQTVWWTENFGPYDSIGRINVSTDAITEWQLPTVDSLPTSITVGPDGALWFAEIGANKIGRITTSGAITEFSLPSGESLSNITKGPDGNLWFTEPIYSSAPGEIGRFNPNTDTFTQFPTTPWSAPDGITAGPDGNIWFTQFYASDIGRMSPTTGAFTLYPIPNAPNAGPTQIVAGPDGNLWFNDNHHSIIGRITPAGQFTEYNLPVANSQASELASGPDGNLWFTSDTQSNYIGQLILDKPLTATNKTVTSTEGAAFSGVVASFTDADPAAAAINFTASIAWGDGSASTGIISANSSGSFNVSGTHTYAEEGQFSVSVTITDVDTSHDVGQNTATATSTAKVADAPLSAVGFNVSGPRSTGNVLVAVFSDAGGAEPASHYRAIINWGDGSAASAGTITANGSLFTVTASHLYPQNGTYPIKVTIRDDGGSAVTTTSTATVSSVYPLTPTQVRTAYGLNVLPLSSNDGHGQTIAIVDAYNDPTIFSDLDTFDKTFSVTPGQTLYQQYGPSSFVLTKATPEGQPQGNAGWAQEIAIDVEWAHAIAPGAKILLVESKTNSLSDLLTAVDYATSQGASVVSLSWGAPEFSSETQYDSHFAHAGVTYVASAGDVGSVTEWPAVSPNVLAVGGTSLTVDTSGNYISETGWSGSGGGISSYEPKPTYQLNVPQGGSYRTSPDVAYVADPNTGVAVYNSYTGGGGWGQWGGTSIGAPQWAALVAIADQGRATPLSSSGTLKALYALLSPGNVINTSYFHDITSGSSGTYSAGPGYDLVTGLGTPHADQLIPYLRTVPSQGTVHFGAGSTAAESLRAGRVPLRGDVHHLTGRPVGLTAESAQELPWAAAVGSLGQPLATPNNGQSAGVASLVEGLPRTDFLGSTVTSFVVPDGQRGHDESEAWSATRSPRAVLPGDAEA
jgi:streptogramin lyase